MSADNFSSENIKFPVLCHYKIIAEEHEGIQSAIEKVFLEVNIRARFERGHHSDHGKYVTFNADVLIHSLELMRHIDRALRKIEGVKFVL